MDAGSSAILFVLVVSVTAVQSQITKGPVNALKKVGDSVTLECVTRSGNCDGVEWKKMEGAQSPLNVYKHGIGIFNGFKERYNVSSTGGCSLIIKQLRISDSGKFSCSLTVDTSEETKGSILVVINVTESCQPLTSINEMIESDSYSFSTVINVPAKSVEPSDVTLSFQNMTAGETETTDDKQPLTVKKTLAGIARKENIMKHDCIASFTPNKVSNFDNSPATLNICTTQQLIVSCPVEDVVVSPSGSYYKEATVSCTAKGYPYPTFKWTHLKSGQVVDGDTMVITGEAGDQYTCTATNTVKGKLTSQSVTIEVSTEPACSSGCIAAIIICVLAVIIIIPVVLFACYKFNWCPFHAKFNSIMVKKSSDKNGERASMPLHPNSTSSPPEKPPRASDTPVPAHV